MQCCAPLHKVLWWGLRGAVVTAGGKASITLPVPLCAAIWPNEEGLQRLRSRRGGGGGGGGGGGREGGHISSSTSAGSLHQPTCSHFQYLGTAASAQAPCLHSLNHRAALVHSESPSVLRQDTVIQHPTALLQTALLQTVLLQTALLQTALLLSEPTSDRTAWAESMVVLDTGGPAVMPTLQQLPLPGPRAGRSAFRGTASDGHAPGLQLAVP